MVIELKSLIDLILVVLVIKLVVSQWYPPIIKSKQAILCIVIGTGFSLLLDPSKTGLVTGIIGSGFAFYGEELITAFKGIADNVDMDTITKVSKKGSKK